MMAEKKTGEHISTGRELTEEVYASLRARAEKAEKRIRELEAYQRENEAGIRSQIEAGRR